MGSSKMQRDSGLLREFQHPYLSVLDAETPYRNGRKHGQVITWAKYMQCQGLGVSVRRFVDGKAEGNSFVRDDDGLLLSWASYRDGQLHGAWHYVDREGDPAEGCPKYFIRGEEVSETQLRDAALSDRDLAASLKFTPPKYAKVPESPSAAFAKKKQAQKSADSSTGIEKQ